MAGPGGALTPRGDEAVPARPRVALAPARWAESLGACWIHRVLQAGDTGHAHIGFVDFQNGRSKITFFESKLVGRGRPGQRWSAGDI